VATVFDAAEIREETTLNPLEAAAHAYHEDEAARAAKLREPIKRARVVSDLYHAADLIRAYSNNEVEVASLAQVTVCGDAR
jgi:hypothetical protein